MNREQFSKILIQHRENALLSKNEMCRKMGINFSQLQRIENYTHNYSLQSAMAYLKIISCIIVLRHNGKNYEIHDEICLGKVLANQRARMGVTIARLAKSLNVSIPALRGIEFNSSKTSVDKFIQCFEGLGYSINVVKV